MYFVPEKSLCSPGLILVAFFCMSRKPYKSCVMQICFLKIISGFCKKFADFTGLLIIVYVSLLILTGLYT